MILSPEFCKIFRNRPAENLYGWKDYEVVGRSIAVILVNEEYCLRLQKITEKLYFGQSWSGQFPFKKRSGEIFMATMTKSLLYENDEIVGVITVASDATFFNSTEVESLKTYNNAVSGRNRTWRMNLKKIQWHPQTPIVPVPEIASSVSHLVHCYTTTVLPASLFTFPYFLLIIEVSFVHFIIELIRPQSFACEDREIIQLAHLKIEGTV